MMTPRPMFLIERIFGNYDECWFGRISVDEAMAELKEISGEDFGENEQSWREWYEEYIARVSREWLSERDSEKAGEWWK